MCTRAIRTKLGNEARWGSGESSPLSQDHLGSRIGSSLTCDYSILNSKHTDDSLNLLHDDGWWRWDKAGTAIRFPASTNGTLRINKNEKKKGRERESSRGEVQGRGDYFIVIQEVRGKERHDSARPLDMAALPVLNQNQRLQLMAKIRNNHRLPLIIFN